MMSPRPDTVTLVLAELDAQARRRFEDLITRARWRHVTASSAAEAEHAIATADVQAIVLGGTDATIDRLRRLTRTHPTMAPLIWQPAHSSEQCALLLRAGARDVLDHRMCDAELHARLAASIGPPGSRLGEAVSMGALAVDAFRGEVTWRGARMPLTSRERDVLDVLVHEHGRTLRRDVIYQRVWGHAMPAGDRNVDVNIKRLRGKLATATDHAVTIETISQVGYRIQLHDDPEGGTTA